MKKHVNGVEVELTAEEIVAHEKSVEDNIKAVEAIKAKEQEKADLKTSAKAKLVAGEALTQEEADTIVL